MNWRNLSKKKKSYVIVFLGLTGVMLWAFVSAGVITHNFNRSQLNFGEDRQEALINGIILTETKDDQKYWEIYGETGNYDSKNEVAMLNNVVGNFYKDNEVSISFESSKGTYNAKKGQIILFEDTFIVMKDGTSLKTNKLEWSGSNVPIIAEGGVTVARGKEFLAKAQKMEISPDFDKFIIKGKAVSKIYDVKEKK